MACAHFESISKGKKDEILSNFKITVRYSLLSRSKHYLKITKKGKELKALLQADDELFSEIALANPDDSTHSTGHHAAINQQMRKKKALQASGMEDIINAIDQLDFAACRTCSDSLSSARLHTCLQCVFIGCAATKSQHQQQHSSHLGLHFKESSHFLAMDFNHCTLFCHHCKDYVYPDVFEQVLFAEQYHLDYIISRIREPFASKPIHPLWRPSEKEAKEIAEKSAIVKCSGMRGLVNLGSTCFMNSILQSLIHNPLMKAHFLSDMHSPRTCSKHKRSCMSCQLDDLFAKCFSTKTSPFPPNQCLHSMWLTQTHMAGYSQQDAHEFFISFLDEVHKSSSSSTTKKRASHEECRCIVHRVFGGVLQSDVTCTTCNAVSLTKDPILDLSLEIKATSTHNGKKRKNGELEVTLLDCLEEFTLPEKLGHGGYKCKSCGTSNGEALKQLSINVLPPVLAIQLKRFEHSEKNSTKLDDFVKIPTTLDMTPLTTRSVKMKTILLQAKTRAPKVSAFDSVADGIPSYKYSLFSVVCHIGKIDTGHYQCYCRVRDGWFLFDDHNITAVSLEQVLRQNVYMCFYIRDHSEYLPDEVVDVGGGTGAKNQKLNENDVVML